MTVAFFAGFPSEYYLDLPAVSTITPVTASDVFVAAFRNVLLWITSTGKVAHAIQLSLGSAQEVGDVGAICGVTASADGRVIVAHVTCRSICVIVEAKETWVFRECDDNWYEYAFDSSNNLIAVHTTIHGTASLFDLKLNLVTNIPNPSGIGQLHVPGESELLIVSGNRTEIFDLRRHGNDAHGFRK